MRIAERFVTHTVENQPKPLPAYNMWVSDQALQAAVQREQGAWAGAHLEAFGAIAGGEMMELGRVANEQRPQLRSFDQYGHRIDEVEFHPAYHALMTHAMGHGVHAFAWRHPEKPGAHVARAALLYMSGQAEAGIACPLTMTYAALPALHHSPALAQEWAPRLTTLQYDARALPAGQKRGCTIGMGMTEKQGGSDVRSNSTRATPQGDGTYALVGHKWFFSAPMSDAHLVLAQTDGGISCFLVPRILSGGDRNAVRIQRLKNKLGDWSNASSEVEFQGALALPVGQEGRGIPTILEMVALTRLDCMNGSAGLIRQALVQALWHTRQRQAFGKYLSDQPLMRNVLADLVLESEAAVALVMRIARAVDRASVDPQEAALSRIATAIGKYWICKRTPLCVNEAQECLGGLGYVEDSMLPRLYRQAPLNSIWEGSGNVQCLDVLRALRREPETRDALFAELQAGASDCPELQQEIRWLGGAFDDVQNLEARSRMIVERVALALQASLLNRAGEEDIAVAFSRSRLAGERGLALGTLQPGLPLGSLVERAF